MDRLGADGWETLCRTDSSWQAARSGYRDTGSWNALDFGGEEVDARRNPRSMGSSDLDRLDWCGVITREKPGHRATPQTVEPDRIQERLAPRMIEERTPGCWRLDFGRVITGWLEARFEGLEPGTRIEFTYSDALEADGRLADQRQSDSYIARGDAREIFRNKFNHHAFRYVEVSGLPRAPRAAEFEALALHTDYRAEATFRSSDDDLNAIHDMIARTLHCLAFNGYMVDCPHLERAGYGGDGNSLDRDAADALRRGAALPQLGAGLGGCHASRGQPAPCGTQRRSRRRRPLTGADSSSCPPGRRGSTTPTARSSTATYDAMCRWMGYVESYMREGLLTRWPDTPYRDWYLGDWLAPGASIRATRPPWRW